MDTQFFSEVSHTKRISLRQKRYGRSILVSLNLNLSWKSQNIRPEEGHVFRDELLMEVRSQLYTIDGSPIDNIPVEHFLTKTRSHLVP